MRKKNIGVMAAMLLAGATSAQQLENTAVYEDANQPYRIKAGKSVARQKNQRQIRLAERRNPSLRNNKKNK